jgi:hypothetical protein
VDKVPVVKKPELSTLDIMWRAVLRRASQTTLNRTTGTHNGRAPMLQQKDGEITPTVN